MQNIYYNEYKLLVEPIAFHTKNKITDWQLVYNLYIKLKVYL